MSDSSDAPSVSKKPYVRKRLIVSYATQLKVMLSTLIVHVAVIGFLYFIAKNSLESLLDFHVPGMSTPVQIAFREYGQAIQNYLDMAFLCAFLVSGFGLFLIQVMLSNRLAGPVYRMTEVLKKINDGGRFAPGSLKLRENDFFKDLAEQLEKLLGKK